MREILFRGKREDSREWVHGMPCATEQSGIYAIQTLEGGIFDIIPETVGQYIGLTDKNGKKIFEGDIINAYTFCGIRDYTEAVVGFSALFVSFMAGKQSLYGECIADSYEVVGNIYDNPELLEEGQK